jgi:hypothetical protein
MTQNMSVREQYERIERITKNCHPQGGNNFSQYCKILSNGCKRKLATRRGGTISLSIVRCTLLLGNLALVLPLKSGP